MYDLSEDEIRLVRRYCILRGIAVPSLIMSILLPVIWVALMAVDDIFLMAEKPYFFGIYAMLFLTGLLLLLFCVGMLVPSFGVRTERWRNLESKIRRTYNLNGSMEGYLTEDRMHVSLEGFPCNKRLHMVAKAFDISLITEKTLKCLLPVAGVVLMVGVFLPEFSISMAAKEQRIVLVTRTLDRIEEVFQQEGYEIYRDEPDYEYVHITCRKDEDPVEYYMYADIDSKGRVEGLSYYLEAVDSLSVEENLRRSSERVHEMNSLLRDSGVKAVHSGIYEMDGIPEPLFSEALNWTGEENQHVSHGDGDITYSLSFSDYRGDEYQKSYFYLMADYWKY